MSTLDADSGELVPDGATQPFPNPGEVALDLAAESAGQVPSVFQKPKLLATVAGHAALAQRIENCLVSIGPLDAMTTADPSGTVDLNLDVTGELVGQSRVLSNGTILTNAMFLLLIALRIKRNSCIGSSPEFLDYLTFVFQTYPGGSTPFRYYDLGGMAVGIEIGSAAPPSSDQIALLYDGPTPRAMAVGVGSEWYDPTEWFAFDEDTRTGAKGFGEIGDPTQGGDFSELF